MSPSKAKTIFNFEALRKKLGFNQAEMANKMSMGSRAYFSLEQDPTAINARHIKLARMVSLEEAVRREDKSLADPQIASLAESFAALAPVAWVIFHGKGRMMRSASSPSTGGQRMEIFKTEAEAKAAAEVYLKNGEKVSAGVLNGSMPGRGIHSHEIEGWLKSE